MFSSSLHGTAAACSNPIDNHHLQQHHNQLLPESPFQNPNPVVQDATGDYVLPIGCTVTPSLAKSKAMNMMPESAEESVPKKIKKKLDIRSKVRTAQGLRDRRVRMSIGIARKFFDLQDLLGFDKPSRTLEWLLTNSNKAILELSGSASSSSGQETAVVKRLGDGHSTLSTHTIKEAAKPSRNDDLQSIMKQKTALLVRESRAKARARARARTVAKLSTANYLNQQKNGLLNNPEDMMSSGDHQTYVGSMPMRKSVESESHKEEERKTGGDYEQHRQSQELQNYDSVIKCHHQWSDLNPNLPLDYWDLNCAYSQQGSSAAHQLNLLRDIYTSSSIYLNSHASSRL